MAVEQNTIELYQDENYGGIKQVFMVTDFEAGALQGLGDLPDDSMSSLKWNLDDGVMVYLFDETRNAIVAEQGEFMVLKGAGENATTHDDDDFADICSGWAWNRE